MKTILFITLFLLFTTSTASSQERSLAEAITDHLSYLGYTCTREDNIISAKHTIKPGFDIQVSNNGILLRSWFQHKESATSNMSAYFQLVNNLNASSTLITFHIDNENDLIAEAWYPLPYTKNSFSTFITTWEYDFSEAIQKNRGKLKDFIS